MVLLGHVTQCEQHQIKEQDVLLDKAGRGSSQKSNPRADRTERKHSLNNDINITEEKSVRVYGRGCVWSPHEGKIKSQESVTAWC